MAKKAATSARPAASISGPGAKAGKLSTGAAKATRAPAAKSVKGGGGSKKIESVEAVAKGIPASAKRESLLKEFAGTVSVLSEKVDKAEASLNQAKDKLKEERAAFGKLSRQLRDATKLLADLTAGRAVPRDLFTDAG